jgi:hypothetical protein
LPRGPCALEERYTELEKTTKEPAMTIPESIRALIATGPPAYLTTLNADGSPQVTLVWVGTEDDEIVIPHMRVWQKVKNMRRDPAWPSLSSARGRALRG